MLQIEFVKDKTSKKPFDTKDRVSFQIQEKGLEHAISLYASPGTVDGVRGDHVILAPPFIVSRDEIDIIVNKAASVFDEVLAKLSSS